MVSFSAPAKVILSGEHAVVFGKPALVCAINRRLSFSVYKKVKKNKKSKKNQVVTMVSDKVKEYLVNEKIKFTDKDFDFKIDSQIPSGRGLGSSAAFSVASVASFLKFYSEKEFSKETMNNLAYKIEKFFHKNPSGVDNTATCFGGLIYFRKEFDFLKNISILNFKISKKIEENLVLVDSGKPLETTAEMVNFVGKLYNKKPLFVERILNNIEKITKRMMVAITKEDINIFQQCLFDNQIFLERLGVVSFKTKKLLKDLNQFGVGKITGAGGSDGGSGFILFFAKKKEKLKKFLKEKKLNFYDFQLDYQGLKENNEKNQS